MSPVFPQFQTQQTQRYTPPMFMQPQGNLYIIEKGEYTSMGRNYPGSVYSLLNRSCV